MKDKAKAHELLKQYEYDNKSIIFIIKASPIIYLKEELIKMTKHYQQLMVTI